MEMTVRVAESWLIAQRAIQLAIVYFSRRNDLLITQPHECDYGVDLLISVTQHGQLTGRLFGVQIKASRHLQIKPISGDKNEYKIKVAIPEVLKDLPFPLCMVAFNMENDDGYYRWILEPIVGPDNVNLSTNIRDVFKKLTKEELDIIVEQVNQWYEKRSKLC
jgi:hypothetical protein